ncbi:MAG TPA: hypothetical protein PK548_00415 [Bacteroidales bacterium]|jgi:hypothetical protein|nr:hypothetical protein [Bacteroidales bacterium]HQA86391.1 hypothetical protein [Bacteroidales bacterium]
MKIKNITKAAIFFIFSFLWIGTIQSQNMGLKVDPRLKDVFSQQKIARLESEGSFKIAVYNYFLDHSYYLSDIAPENGKNMGSVSDLVLVNGEGHFQETIDIFKNQSFNPYLYDIQIPYDTPIYYVIEEGKNYLIFYARGEYEANLAKYLNQEKIIIQ